MKDKTNTHKLSNEIYLDHWGEDAECESASATAVWIDANRVALAMKRIYKQLLCNHHYKFNPYTIGGANYVSRKCVKCGYEKH